MNNLKVKINFKNLKHNIILFLVLNQLKYGSNKTKKMVNIYQIETFLNHKPFSVKDLNSINLKPMN